MKLCFTVKLQKPDVHPQEGAENDSVNFRWNCSFNESFLVMTHSSCQSREVRPRRSCCWSHLSKKKKWNWSRNKWRETNSLKTNTLVKEARHHVNISQLYSDINRNSEHVRSYEGSRSSAAGTSASSQTIMPLSLFIHVYLQQVQV